MRLVRVENWDTVALHDFLMRRASARFVWGSHDCALFAADAVQVVTGTDIADDFRGKYDDEAGAFALIETVTGGSTVGDAAAWCATKYEMPEYKHVLLAKRGDLVVVEDAGSLIAGIVHLSGREVVVAGPSGLKTRPLDAIQRAWAV